MGSSAPSRLYYEACAGAWRGVVELTVTDRDALRRAPLTVWDRARVRALLASTRIFGSARIDTTVRVTGEREVIHTTRIGQLGMPSFVSREIIALDSDGRRGTITISQRLFPFFFPLRTEGPFPVTVDESAKRASYELVFLGCPMRQTGEREGPDRVTLIQETTWSRSVQRLHRRPLEIAIKA